MHKLRHPHRYIIWNVFASLKYYNHNYGCSYCGTLYPLS